jgi:hypothetical protein
VAALRLTPRRWLVVPGRHYWEERNFGSSREFGLEPHHSFDLETDVMCLLDKEAMLRLQLVAEQDDKSATELAAFVPDLLMETRHSVKVHPTAVIRVVRIGRVGIRVSRQGTPHSSDSCGANRTSRDSGVKVHPTAVIRVVRIGRVGIRVSRYTPQQ